jgi:2-dehydro-3-deoxygluconokinase
MKFKQNATYDIVVPTSMGVRITPINRQPVHTGSLFLMQATSAESNVISSGASLGLKTKVLTAFVKDSPIAHFIKNDLARRHIEYDNNEKIQDGPWGYRHQFNIADSGYGGRAPRVQNDRAGEVGRSLSVSDFDVEALLQKDGVKLIHISGLIAALSETSSEFCLELTKQAKQSGTRISFDINYRASFWKNREAKLREVFHQIASLSDILIGNEEDFQLALGVKGPESGGKGLGSNIDGFQTMLENMKQEYPKTTIFATTLREVKSANEHLWGAIVSDPNDVYVVEPRPIQVLDRIGGGDGFVGGFLYGLLTGMTTENACHFGWANGAFTATLLEDYSMPLSEEQIWSVWEGNARVRR